jgi:hypothetical protein
MFAGHACILNLPCPLSQSNPFSLLVLAHSPKLMITGTFIVFYRGSICDYRTLSNAQLMIADGEFNSMYKEFILQLRTLIW